MNVNGKNIKYISENLVGSRLFGLESVRSDYDYVILYKSDIRDYLTLGNFEDSMPDQKVSGSREINFVYWDVKKFLKMCSNHSWKAFEFLKATECYRNNPDYKILLQDVPFENFSLRPILFSCAGLVNNSSKQRGYMKAYFWLVIEYITQHNQLPTELNAWVLLNSVKLDHKAKLHLTYLFYQKVIGVKSEEFLLSVDTTKFESFPKPTFIDYTATFHKIIGV